MQNKETIGRYQVRGQLGQGGMASVVRAFDPSFDREVAIKTLPQQLSHNEEFRARFSREAKTIAALEHPAIVPVYDVGEEEGLPYLVMRFMTGGSLADHMTDEGLPIDEVARMVERMADALDHAHQQGFIHRDLKPANILFDANSKPYIGDFGIARMIEAGGTLTGSGVIGTPLYMSPEQASGSSLDHRSDIYALGVMVYEMLTGALPYNAETPMGIAVKHMMEPVPDIRAQRGDLPPMVETVINKAMAKNPDQRYQTAAALAADLQRVAKGEQPLAAAEEIPTTMPMTMPMPEAVTPTPTTVVPAGQPQSNPIIPIVLAALGGALGLFGLLFLTGIIGPNTAASSEPTVTTTPETTAEPESTDEPTAAPTDEPALGPTPAQFAYAIGDADRLEVRVKLGATEMSLESRDIGTDAVRAQFEVTNEDVHPVSTTYEVRANTGIVNIEQQVPALYIKGEDPFGVLDVALPSDIPIDLTLSTGIEDANVDLSGLTITRLNITENSGDLRVRLPASGEIEIRLATTYGPVTLEPAESSDLIVKAFTISEPFAETRVTMPPMPTYTMQIGEVYNTLRLRFPESMGVRVEKTETFAEFEFPAGYVEIEENVIQSPAYAQEEPHILLSFLTSSGTIIIDQ